MYEVGSGDLGTFQQTGFEEQLYVLRGIGDVFEDMGGNQRSDREMSVALLRDSARSKTMALDSIREESREHAIRSVERALGQGLASDSARPASGRLTKTFALADGSQLPSDELTRTVVVTAQTNTARFDALKKRASQYGVEIHKKLVIATACIVFVLVGVPVGIRFPRGGISMVIFVSAIVTGVFNYGLTTGEDWADRDLAAPFWSMWAPSLIFLVVGAIMVSRMGRWTASARDSGWREIWLATRNGARALFRRRRRTA